MHMYVCIFIEIDHHESYNIIKFHLQLSIFYSYQASIMYSINIYIFRKGNICLITTMHLSPLSCSKSYSLVRFPTQQENEYLPLFLILCPCLVCFIICCTVQGKNKMQSVIPTGNDFLAMEITIIVWEKPQANSKTTLNWYKAWFGSNPFHVMVTWVTLKENGLLHFRSRI